MTESAGAVQLGLSFFPTGHDGQGGRVCCESQHPALPSAPLQCHLQLSGAQLQKLQDYSHSITGAALLLMFQET